jgi:hypothetical protein
VVWRSKAAKLFVFMGQLPTLAGPSLFHFCGLPHRRARILGEMGFPLIAVNSLPQVVALSL